MFEDLVRLKWTVWCTNLPSGQATLEYLTEFVLWLPFSHTLQELQATDKQVLRDFLFDFLVTRGATVPSMVATKAAKVCVDIAAVDWGRERYPDFLDRVRMGTQQAVLF